MTGRVASRIAVFHHKDLYHGDLARLDFRNKYHRNFLLNTPLSSSEMVLELGRFQTAHHRNCFVATLSRWVWVMPEPGNRSTFVVVAESPVGKLPELLCEGSTELIFKPKEVKPVRDLIERSDSDQADAWMQDLDRGYTEQVNLKLMLLQDGTASLDQLRRRIILPHVVELV